MAAVMAAENRAGRNAVLAVGLFMAVPLAIIQF
jgi:hypothetical protein